MYRQKIRDYYDQLSRSYRKVADFVLSNYYEVAFMTASQLANAVGVDTTTVVRFAQRLGYHGYPELLRDIRDQVRAETYAAYQPERLSSCGSVAAFQRQIEQDQSNMRQILIHNPPERIQAVAGTLRQAGRIFFLADGCVNMVAAVAAQHFRLQNVVAEAVAEDAVMLAATLVNLHAQDLMVGISATEHGEGIARAMEFARSQGCGTLGIIGSLASPVNRAADQIIYAPASTIGPLPSVVTFIAVLFALLQLMDGDGQMAVEQGTDDYHDIYRFLTAPKPEELASTAF